MKSDKRMHYCLSCRYKKSVIVKELSVDAWRVKTWVPFRSEWGVLFINNCPDDNRKVSEDRVVELVYKGVEKSYI